MVAEPSLSKRAEDVLETVNCLLCGSDRFKDLVPEGIVDTDGGEYLEEPLRSMRFQLVSCLECDTVYLRQRPKQSEIGAFYAGEYHCYKSFNERGALMCTLGKLLAASKLKAIEKLMPPGSKTVLDYGCGSGSWIELMKIAGAPFEMIGSDIIPEQIEVARKLGIEAFVANEDDLQEKLGGRKVGLIHMNHVIEHLPDPVKVLKALRDVLVDGGVIYGQTPNIDSADCRMFSKYWVQWHIPRHLVLYTPETIRKHAEAAGLEVVFIKNSLSSATNWANSILKRQAMKAGKEYHLSSHPLYPVLILASMPQTALQLIFSRTSNIDFAFRKIK